jgi:hypothetical protein
MYRICVQADVLNLFSTRSRWILLGNATVAQAALADLRVLLDSDVIAAERDSARAFFLVELYRRTSHDAIMQRVIGEWRHQRGVRLISSPIIFSRRTNLHKSTLKAVMVVSRANPVMLQPGQFTNRDGIL